MAVLRWLRATCVAGVLIALAWKVTDLYLEPTILSNARHSYKRALENGAFPNGYSAKFTAGLLLKQFQNPAEITTILLLVGGDVVQKSVAQLAGCYDSFVPVVFSYGWVSYVFTLLTNAIARNGSFAPPDYPGVLVNLRSGDRRSLQSWVLARLLRDLEQSIDPRGRIASADTTDRPGLFIATYQIDETKMPDEPRVRPKMRRQQWLLFFAALLTQLVIAAVPMMPTPHRKEPNFYVLLITVAGNILSLLTAGLQSSRDQKYGAHGSTLQCKDIFALTKGNGHNIAIVILPDTFDSGRANQCKSHLPHLDSMAEASYRPTRANRIWTVVLSFLWVLLLLVIGGSTADNWNLAAVGAVGMAYAAYVGSSVRRPEDHGIPLERASAKWTVQNDKAMLALIDLEERIPGAGYMLRSEFFTGPERIRDRQLWDKSMLRFEEQLSAEEKQSLEDEIVEFRKQRVDFPMSWEERVELLTKVRWKAWQKKGFLEIKRELERRRKDDQWLRKHKKRLTYTAQAPLRLEQQSTTPEERITPS
ncbi:hypothetical protein IF1G_09627 [Cordyceps javanica]|uniref:Uncharacterized protein n=1 Tax=Cordyceps javanica TaxID=43265 RepID=A0A545VPK9_9HYPO|nr:hypothetical protein IF1G_09627 [Cordyceps javanica]TQW03652.1 hypothetical protein IF2G_08950 [Cordyceps javanica]